MLCGIKQTMTMKHTLLATTLTLMTVATHAQSRFPKNQISVNGFRNPSIGLEYQRNNVSVHAGYYITAFESGVTTKFAKAGVTYWFAPVGKKDVPSSFYAQLSYLRGLNLDYTDVNAASLDVGFRWMAWKGLHLDIGVIALAAPDKDVKINPTPGIGYSFTF